MTIKKQNKSDLGENLGLKVQFRLGYVLNISTSL